MIRSTVVIAGSAELEERVDLGLLQIPELHRPIYEGREGKGEGGGRGEGRGARERKGEKREVIYEKEAKNREVLRWRSKDWAG